MHSHTPAHWMRPAAIRLDPLRIVAIVPHATVADKPRAIFIVYIVKIGAGFFGQVCQALQRPEFPIGDYLHDVSPDKK